MKTGMRTFLAAIVAILLAGCGMSRHDRHAAAMLDRAEAVMQSHPDSARTIVDSIDATAIGSDALRARYALDLHEVMFKNYIETPDDSLISFAADYFADRGDNASLAKARYFQGRALYMQQKMKEAMVVSLKAEEAAHQSPTVWKARISELLADIYHYTYCIPQEIEQRQKTADYYYEVDSIRNVMCALIDKASALCDNAEFESSRLLSDSVITTYNSSDSLILGFAYFTRAKAYVGLKDGKAARNDLNNSLKLGFDYSGQFGDYYDFMAYMLCNQTDSAEIVLKDIEANHVENSEMPADYLYPKYLYAKKIGNNDTVIAALETLYEKQNVKMRNMMSQYATSTNIEYQKFRKKELETDLKQRTVIFTIIFITALLIASLLYVIFRQKLRSKEMSLQIELENVRHLTIDLLNYEKDITGYQEKLAAYHAKEESRLKEEELQLNKNSDSDNIFALDLIEDSIKSFNSIYDEYYKIDKPSDDNKIYRALEQAVEDMSSDSYIMKLIQLTDKKNNNILSSLKEQLPRLTDKDFKLIGLILSGLSPRSICVLLGIKYNNYYTKAHRLRTLIRESEIEGKEGFLELLTFSKS